MTQHASTVTASLLPIDQPLRLHPATLVLAVVRLGPQMVQMLPAVIALGVTGNVRYIAPALAVFMLLSIGFAWVAWTRFQWQVSDNLVSIKSGVLSRKDRTIPFDRIQDVTIEQGLVQRLLGLASVGFETGSAAQEGEDGKLNAIAMAQAAALRDHIRDQRGQPAPTPAAQDVGVAIGAAQSVAATETPEVELFTMTPTRLIHAGIYNFSLAVIGVLFGLLQTFDDLLPFDPFSPDIWVAMAGDSQLANWLLAHQIVSAVAGLVGLILLGMVTGVVRTVLRDWGFRLARTARGFRRTRGLTTRSDVAIPVARVQAALIVTGWVRRMMGWYELKLQSLATDGKNEKDHVVAPFARLGEIDVILAELALDRAEFEEGGATAEPSPATGPENDETSGGEVASRVWHRSLFGPTWIAPLSLIMLALVQFVVTRRVEPDLLWVSALTLAAAPLLLLIGWLAWRHRRWRLDGTSLHITSGVLLRRHIILPIGNVQSADIRIGPVLRRIGGATLIFGVPGGSGDLHRIEAIPMAAAIALRAKLLPA